MDERRKLYFDFFKHLTTLAVATVLFVSGLFGTLLQANQKTMGEHIVVFGGLASSLLLSLRAMVVVMKSDDDKMKGYLKDGSMSMSLAPYVFVCAVLFGCNAVYNAVNVKLKVEEPQQNQPEAKATATGTPVPSATQPALPKTDSNEPPAPRTVPKR